MEKRYYFYTAIIFIVGIFIGCGATWFYVSRAEARKYSAIISSTNERVSNITKQLEDSERGKKLLTEELERSNNLVKQITDISINSTKHIEGISKSLDECFNGMDRIDRINKNINDILNR